MNEVIQHNCDPKHYEADVLVLDGQTELWHECEKCAEGSEIQDTQQILVDKVENNHYTMPEDVDFEEEPSVSTIGSEPTLREV